MVTETFKRSVFVGPGQIRWDDVPIPEPGPREALVRVRACAICTWEQRVYSGEDPFYPLAGGHEISGELVKTGSMVYSDAKPGDRVVVSALTRCGYCESCRRGLDSNCDNNRKTFRAGGSSGPGGLSEYVLIDDYQLFKASNTVSFEELCLAEPVSCVTRSIRKARVERGDTVVVIGAGIMGMLHLVLARQMAARVIVSEPAPARAEFARKMGADLVIDPTQAPFAEQVKAATGGRGADVIVCAVSAAAALEGALDAAAKGGRVHVYASIFPKGAKIAVDPNIFHNKEVVLTGTVSQDRNDMFEAVRMISLGLVDVKPFVSLVLPLPELEKGLKAALAKDAYRVVMTM